MRNNSTRNEDCKLNKIWRHQRSRTCFQKSQNEVPLPTNEIQKTEKVIRWRPEI